jgi:hypothetical protein
MRSLCISLHLYFCSFTSESMFLSAMLGIIMILVVSFINAHTLLYRF